ncbi:MAG: hypothetical protein ACT4NY_09000 [Pseudonocardiales bacterium]
MARIATTGGTALDRIALLESRLAELERRVASPETVAMRDWDGNVLVQPDPATGVGLGRPYLACALHSEFWSSWNGTQSGDWVMTHLGQVFRQHPKVIVTAAAISDTDTEGQVDALVNGEPLGYKTIPGGSGINRLYWGPSLVPGAHLGVLTVHLRARRNTGTGWVRVGSGDCWGVQT